MAIRIGPQIGIEGERAFRASLREIRADAQLLQQQMDKLSESFSRNDTAMQRSTKTREQLNRQISQENTSLAENRNMRDRAVKAAEDAIDRYNKQYTTLQQMNKEYAKGEGDLKAYSDALGAGHPFVQKLAKAQNDLSKRISEGEKNLNKYEVAVYRSSEVASVWEGEVIKSERSLEKLERELLKTPNYLEEFQRNTEGSQKKLEGLEREVELTGKSLQLAQTKYNTWTTELRRNADTQDYLKRKLEALQKVLTQTTQLRKQAGEVVYKEEQSYYNLTKKLEEAKKQYGENSKEARLLTDAVAEQKRRVEEATDTYNGFIDKEKETKIAIGQTTQELHNQKNAFMIVGDKIESIGNNIMDFGGKVTQYVTTPLIGAATASVKFASDFRDGMAKVYTIADEAAVPMETMADGLKRLSDESGFGLDDLTEAAYQAVSASVKTEDAVDFLTQATKLARAGFTDTTTAVDILSTVMNTYGHEAYSAAEISDILLKTQNDGKTIVDQLANRMGIIIPMAKNYGVSLEQIAAGYATMTKQGVKTEMATTYFRAMFTELEKEGSDVSDLLDTLTGKTFKQLMDSGWDIADVLRLLWNHVDGNSEAFQRLFGNVRSTQAVAALAADDFGILEQELDAMQNTTGLVDEALETLQTPGLQARKTINRLKNATEEFGEDLLKDLLPVLDKVVGWVEKWTKAYRDADKPTRDLIKNIIGLVAAVGPAITGLGAVVKVGGMIAKSFGAVGALLSTGTIPGVVGLSGAFGALLPAIGAVGVALGGLLIYDAYSNQKYQEYIQQTYGLTEAEKALCDRINTNTEAMRTGREATQENVESILANTDGVYKLIERYNELVDEEGNVKEGAKGLAEVLLGEIAEALGLSVEQVKELRDEHGLLTGAIEQTIEAKKRDAILEAYREDWIASLKNEAHARMDVAEAQKQLDGAIEEGEQLHQAQNDLEAENLRLLQETGAGVENYNEKMQELDDAIAANAEKQKELGDAVDGANTELDAALQTSENYENAMQAVTEGSENAGTAVDMLTEGFKRAGAATGEELRQQYEDTKQHYEDLKEAVANGAEDITEEEMKAAEYRYQQAYKEYLEYNQMARSEAERGSKEQAVATNKYMSEAKMRAGQQKQAALNGYKDTYNQAGREGSETSKSYAHSVDDYQSTAYTNAGVVLDAAISGLEDGGRAYERGKEFGLGYASGLTAKAVISGVISGAESIVNLANNTIASKQQSGSPSKVAAERGEEFGEGYALGIDNTSSLVSSAANGLVNSALMDSMMMDNMTSYGGWASARTVNAPINVNVNVNGNVDDYGELADVIAERINTQVLQKQGAF